MALKFRVLKTELELQEFTSQYQLSLKGRNLGGVNLSVEVLQEKSKVVAIFKGKKMVAGYALSEKMHTFEHYGTEKAHLKMSCILDGDPVFDLGNIWRSKDMSSKTFKFTLWPLIVLHTILYRPNSKYVVGYVFTGHGRAKDYDLTKPIYLQESSWEGEINIFLMSKKNLVKGFLKGAFFQLAPGMRAKAA